MQPDDRQPPPSQEHAASPARLVARQPVLALIANLLAAPLGYLYVGAPRRGIVMWFAFHLAAALALAPLILSPGLPALVVAMVVPFGFGLFVGIDAFVIARRRGSDYRLRPYNRWYVYVGAVALAVLCGNLMQGLRRAEVQAYRIPAESMSPTLLAGDFVFVDKVSHHLQGLRRGEIVVFPFPPNPKDEFVKRIVALPNEVVEIRDKQVFVDGVALDEPYVIHSDSDIRPAGYDARDNYGPFKVPAGELFVMGDNRDNSNDSRYWGTLATRAVKGRAAVIYWSWDGGRSEVRWGRIGSRIAGAPKTARPAPTGAPSGS